MPEGTDKIIGFAGEFTRFGERCPERGGIRHRDPSESGKGRAVTVLGRLERQLRPSSAVRRPSGS
ncbi:hypothetical protein GCM10027360_59070 [Amycolatopsis echigonensis]